MALVQQFLLALPGRRLRNALLPLGSDDRPALLLGKWFFLDGIFDFFDHVEYLFPDVAHDGKLCLYGRTQMVQIDCFLLGRVECQFVFGTVCNFGHFLFH